MGIGGRSRSSTGRRKTATSDSANLAKAKVPKYIATGLFPKVTAYTLRRDRYQLGDEDEADVPQRDEYVRRGEEKQCDNRISAGPGDAPGWGRGMKLAEASSSCKQRSDLSPGLRTNSVEKSQRLGWRFCSCWTDHGTPRATRNVNMPEPESNERDPVLSIR